MDYQDKTFPFYENDELNERFVRKNTEESRGLQKRVII